MTSTEGESKGSEAKVKTLRKVRKDNIRRYRGKDQGRYPMRRKGEEPEANVKVMTSRKGGSGTKVKVVISRKTDKDDQRPRS